MWLSPLEPRASNNNPCPQANGTSIGTFQPFTVLCGQDLRGDTINRTDTDNFLTCIDFCASFHPKCEGIAFSRRGCELKANLRSGGTRDSKFQDAATAQFPTASSNCGSLGSSTASGTTQFNVFCGKIVAGNDMAQAFAPTFQDCLSQCTGTQGCGGVSFDASMSQGFKNCYMKGPASSSTMAPDSGIDTAIVNNAAAADPVPSSQSSVPASNVPSSSPSPSSAAPSTPATPFATTAEPPSTTTVLVSANPVTVTASAAPATTTAAAPPATASTSTTAAVVPASASSTAALSFSTIAGTPTAVVPETSVLTQTVLSVITSVGESATEVLTVPVTVTPYGMGMMDMSTAGAGAAAAAATEGAAVVGVPGSDAKAWIAAPVVGSIAAITVIAAAFVMWGKRRTSSRGRGGGSSFSGGGGPSFLSRLPFIGGSREDLGSMRERAGSRTGLTLPFGNYWRLGASKLADEESTSSRGGSGLPSRNGAATRENTPQYEVKQGKMALRDSLNGLAQNRSTLDGIPGFLRE